MRVIHTREGHRPDLSDLTAFKRPRAAGSGAAIGSTGPLGRLLVRGEPGHAIIEEAAPLPGETVIDKPGFGAFYATDLELILRSAGISRLTLAGVTTDICVHSTLREAVDRGFDCTTVGDACAAGDPAIHEAMLACIAGEGGILGQCRRDRGGGIGLAHVSSVAPLDEPLEGEAGSRSAPAHRLGIRGPLDRRRYVLIAMASFALGLASWWAVTALALVDPLFLPGPAAVLRRFVTWLGEGTLAADAGISVFRVTAGFLLSAVMAVPLSLLIGSYRPVRAFFEPLLEFSRYLPAVAFVPLVLLWVGIGEASKILVIWIGTFFQMVIMLSEDVGRVPAQQVEAARTMGATGPRDHPRRAVALGHAGDVRHLAHHARMGMDLSRGRRAGRRQLQVSAMRSSRRSAFCRPTAYSSASSSLG